jgi:hypothetical protein
VGDAVMMLIWCQRCNNSTSVGFYIYIHFLYQFSKTKAMNKRILMTSVAVATAMMSQAQLDTSKLTPESSELWHPVPRVVTPGNASVTAAPSTAPSDAIVLFDGRDLSKWKSATTNSGEPKWTVADGAVTVKPGTGDIETKDQFQNYQLHIEFRTPAEVKGSGQGRGNSGIFMQGVYELQVLDSYNNRTYSNGQAGSIYKRSMPLVNASKKPGEWQTYDVIYMAPQFNKDSMVIEPGYITVLHNGVLVQNHTPIIGTTPYIGAAQIQVHGKGPIRLQDHSNPTSFRNIWIREL